MSAQQARDWLVRARKEGKAELGWYCCQGKVGLQPHEVCPNKCSFPTARDLFFGHGLESVQHLTPGIQEVYFTKDAITP